MATAQNMRRPHLGQPVVATCALGDGALHPVHGNFLDIVYNDKGGVEGYSLAVPQATREDGSPLPAAHMFLQGVFSLTWDMDYTPPPFEEDE